MVTNPFTFGNPISDSARFYGRVPEIRQIVSRLRSSAHESTSLQGERRIGKTSLLLHLADSEVAPTLGLAPSEYCMVFIDLQGLTDITPAKFWSRVLTKIARTACNVEVAQAADALRQQPQIELSDLQDFMDVVRGQGQNIVLLFDEFEYVMQNPNFDLGFFGKLRSLTIHHPLSLLVSTRTNLADLCHSEEILGSPFFNIFSNVVLGPFSRAEVDEMVQMYAEKGELTLAPADRDLIYALGGGHPFFVQMAGHYLADGKLQGLEHAALREYTTSKFNEEANPHFSYYWQHCSDSEKITLLSIMTLNRQPFAPQNVPTLENLARLYPRARLDLVSLTKRGLVREDKGAYTLFSPGLDAWVSREITAPVDEQESTQTVDAWLKQGGQERLAPMKGTLPKVKKQYWPLVTQFLGDFSMHVVTVGTVELLRRLLS